MTLSPYRPTTTDIFNPLEAFFGPMGSSRVGNVLRAPSADVIERENEIEVHIEIPGMNPEDINIELENNLLTVSGEKQEEREEDGDEGTYHLSERRYGRFTRSFVLPRDVEPEGIEAHCDNGLLMITVPKSERARRRRIEVRRGNGGKRQIEAKGSEKKAEKS
jgi:HSP20 family protein